jgi:hypothetical protein
MKEMTPFAALRAKTEVVAVMPKYPATIDAKYPYQVNPDVNNYCLSDN